MRLSVSYLSGARPPGAPPAEPRIRFNGNWLRGDRGSEPAGEFERVTLGFELPATWVERGMNRLEIHSQTWVPESPNDAGDERALGIMIDAVTIEPASAS